MPDAAITTDIIVGFPGETEEDFAQTLEVVAAARFSGAYTFQYSKRPGTPAADPARPGPARRRAGPLRAAGRARQRHRLGREQAPGRSHRRADGRRGRGPQGRRDPPALRSWPGQPARPLRTGSRDRRARLPRPTCSARATWSPSRSPAPPRTTWSPTAACWPCGAPGPATPGRPARRPAAPVVGLGCRRWRARLVDQVADTGSRRCRLDQRAQSKPNVEYGAMPPP